MLLRQKRIDGDVVALAVNERDSIGNPGEMVRARRATLGGAPALLGQKLPFQRSHNSFLSLDGV